METWVELDAFYELVLEDPRIGPAHISLYIALLHLYGLGAGKNPLPIQRRQIMPLAKISSRSTYYKCIRDLHDFGYIKYRPSCDLEEGSAIFMKKL